MGVRVWWEMSAIRVLTAACSVSTVLRAAAEPRRNRASLPSRAESSVSSNRSSEKPPAMARIQHGVQPPERALSGRPLPDAKGCPGYRKTNGSKRDARHFLTSQV